MVSRAMSASIIGITACETVTLAHVLRVARTIADLADEATVGASHIAEAVTWMRAPQAL